jgi:hypothetical protein
MTPLRIEEWQKTMHIYFKNSDRFKEATVPFGSSAMFNGILIQELKGLPHIVIDDDIDVDAVMAMDIKDLMLKATRIEYPKYEKHRECGLYAFGKAKAELIFVPKGAHKLRLETTSLEGIADMRTLSRMLHAGSIAPNISYEGESKGQNLLQILRQLLWGKKLSWFQRFVLALRLTKNTQPA